MHRRLKYQGTARIRLEVLHFRWDRPRELDSKHVEYLKALLMLGLVEFPSESVSSEAVTETSQGHALSAGQTPTMDTSSPDSLSALADSWPDTTARTISVTICFRLVETRGYIENHAVCTTGVCKSVPQDRNIWRPY